MSKTKRIPPGGQVVTEKRLAELLSGFARAADASFAVKLAAMEERLRDEFGASRVLEALDEEAALAGLVETVTDTTARLCALDEAAMVAMAPPATYEGNELAPKAGE